MPQDYGKELDSSFFKLKICGFFRCQNDLLENCYDNGLLILFLLFEI